MDYQDTITRQAHTEALPEVLPASLPISLHDYRAYRVSVEVLVDTGYELLMVSPFGGNAFTANFWSLPSGDVELDELPDDAALRIAREATNLLVELTPPTVLKTRVIKTERNGRVYRRLVYTYVVGVCRDWKGDLLERFCLGRDYVGHTWLKHGEREILGRKFDSLDKDVRAVVAGYQGILL